MAYQGSVALSGALSMHRIGRGGSLSATPAKVLSLLDIARLAFPHFGCSREVSLWRLRNLPNLWRGLWRVLIARLFNLSNFYGVVSLVKISDGKVIDYGLASLRLVTTAGVNFLVDALQGTVEPEILKYHGFGTGTTAESAAHTALVTELTTEYVVNSTRPTGSQTEGASANIYRSVGTLSPDSGGTLAITEHALFSADAAGTMLDRSVFSAVNLVAGSDSLQVTFDLTLATGS